MMNLYKKIGDIISNNIEVDYLLCETVNQYVRENYGYDNFDYNFNRTAQIIDLDFNTNILGAA